MKSPLISGFRHTTTRTESPGARLTCSPIGVGVWAATGVKRPERPATKRIDRRLGRYIDLTRSTSEKGGFTGYSPAQRHYLCLRQVPGPPPPATKRLRQCSRDGSGVHLHPSRESC